MTIALSINNICNLDHACLMWLVLFIHIYVAPRPDTHPAGLCTTEYDVIYSTKALICPSNITINCNFFAAMNRHVILNAF